MRVAVETLLPMAKSEVLAQVSTPALLRYVAAPMMRFVPLDPSAFPAQWAPGQYRVAAFLLGFIPLGRQTIDINLVGSTDDEFAVRDNGHGDLARRWDHRIIISEANDGQTHYRDMIDIEAGLLTPFVWAFAQVFYRHRQQRWRRLARARSTHQRHCVPRLRRRWPWRL